MQMRLELIPLPVSDVDRSIAFYADKLGFKKDFDVQPSEGVQIVQLTPEGSGCSVGFGTGLDVYAGEPGSVRGLRLAVEDITEARAELVRRGVEISEIRVAVQPSEGLRIVQLTPEDSGCPVGFGTGLDVYAGEPGSVRGLHFGGGVKGADFSDPDGNTFELQQMSWRKGATYQELADSAPVGCGMNAPAVDFNR